MPPCASVTVVPDCSTVPLVAGKVSVVVPATAAATTVVVPDVEPAKATVFENVTCAATLIEDAYYASDSMRSTIIVPAKIYSPLFCFKCRNASS